MGIQQTLGPVLQLDQEIDEEIIGLRVDGGD